MLFLLYNQAMPCTPLHPTTVFFFFGFFFLKKTTRRELESRQHGITVDRYLSGQKADI